MFTILINVMLYPVKFIAVFYQFFGTVQDPNTGDFLDQMVVWEENDGGRSSVLFGRSSIWAAARVHVK